MKNSRSREKLSSCMQICADDKIRKLATLRNDPTILTVTADELIAKEACYHRTCYKDYTRPDYAKRNKESKVNIDDEFSEVFKFLSKLHENPEVVEFKKLQSMVSSVDDKKNLKRKIESKTNEFNFIHYGKGFLIYPNSLKMEDLVIATQEAQLKLQKYENMDTDQKVVLRCANIIREEIKNIKYKMPWPPGPKDLDMSNFVNSQYLDLFLETLLGSGDNSPLTDRVVRLKSSFGQDLSYAGKYFL